MLDSIRVAIATLLLPTGWWIDTNAERYLRHKRIKNEERLYILRFIQEQVNKPHYGNLRKDITRTIQAEIEDCILTLNRLG